jgi:CBS domain-containing protein
MSTDGGPRGLCSIERRRHLLGYLGGDAFDAAPQTAVDQVMEPGPSTIRPHVSLAEIAQHMQERDIDRILVTTATG